MTFLLPMVVGCTTMIVDQNSTRAIDTTVGQARFDLECQDVTATLVSQRVAQGDGPEASEHTIEVHGCGRQALYQTTCPAEGDCVPVSKSVGNLKFAPQVEP